MGGAFTPQCHATVAPQPQPLRPRDVRKVPIRVISISKGNSKGVVAYAEELADKIRRYAPFAELQLAPNPKKAASPAVQVQAEGEKVGEGGIRQPILQAVSMRIPSHPA